MTAFWLLRAPAAPAAGRVAGIQPPQSIEITNRSRRGLSKAAADQLQRNHGPMARTRKPGTHARPAAGGVPWQANSGRRSAGATRAQTIVCLPRQRRCTLGSPAGRVRATAPLARGAVCSACPSDSAGLPPGEPSERRRTRVRGFEACCCCPAPGKATLPAGSARLRSWPAAHGSAGNHHFWARAPQGYCQIPDAGSCCHWL
jgi:hypothetical protein